MTFSFSRTAIKTNVLISAQIDYAKTRNKTNTYFQFYHDLIKFFNTKSELYVFHIYTQAKTMLILTCNSISLKMCSVK